MFLNDEGGLIMTLEINCLMQKLGIEARATRYWNFCRKRCNLWHITDVSLAMG